VIVDQVGPDQGDQHIAGGDRSRYRSGKIDAWLDRVDVHENLR
jgi:hypothetical protein